MIIFKLQIMCNKLRATLFIVIYLFAMLTLKLQEMVDIFYVPLQCSHLGFTYRILNYINTIKLLSDWTNQGNEEKMGGAENYF